jgi:16S rRNA (adenine1518-N6/adenine1519-N6)-dimethyltransferase
MEAATVDANDVILEVGPGTGALTTLLAGRAAAVVAIDVDRAMARLTTEAVAGLDNVQVLVGDALANKSTIEPRVLDSVRNALAGGNGRNFKVVANLPYHIATPLIINLLVHPELCPTLIVVTIQKELADRLCAQASTAAYGAVSVVIQNLADVSLVRALPPSAFWPRPKVDSAVVALRPNAEKRAAVGDVAWFHDIVRRVLCHRRKYIRHVLAGIWPDRWSKAEVDSWLESQGYSGQSRAESLSVDAFRSLALALRQRWGDLPHEIDDATDEPAIEIGLADDE